MLVVPHPKWDAAVQSMFDDALAPLHEFAFLMWSSDPSQCRYWIRRALPDKYTHVVDTDIFHHDYRTLAMYHMLTYDIHTSLLAGMTMYFCAMLLRPYQGICEEIIKSRIMYQAVTRTLHSSLQYLHPSMQSRLGIAYCKETVHYDVHRHCE
jgi:hypothetical protein